MEVFIVINCIRVLKTRFKFKIINVFKIAILFFDKFVQISNENLQWINKLIFNKLIVLKK